MGFWFGFMAALYVVAAFATAVHCQKNKVVARSPKERVFVAFILFFTWYGYWICEIISWKKELDDIVDKTQT